jgi:hypothetical protein
MAEEISKDESKPKKELKELSPAQKRLKRVVWTMRIITVGIAVIFIIYLYFWVKRHAG